MIVTPMLFSLAAVTHPTPRFAKCSLSSRPSRGKPLTHTKRMLEHFLRRSSRISVLSGLPSHSTISRFFSFASLLQRLLASMRIHHTVLSSREGWLAVRLGEVGYQTWRFFDLRVYGFTIAEMVHEQIASRLSLGRSLKQCFLNSFARSLCLVRSSSNDMNRGDGGVEEIPDPGT